jgi:hypothetical protein
MISGTPISLWFLIHGRTSIFEITIGKNNIFLSSRKLSSKLENPSLTFSLWIDFKLLKLKNPVDDRHFFEIQNLTLQDDGNENNNVALMKDMQKIVIYWPKNQVPPEDLIHVIIEIPGEP